MTRGRQIGLKLLHKKWYNPRAGQEETNIHDAIDKDAEAMTNMEPPSLKKAWVYFEHVILSRFMIGEQKRQD